MPGIQHVFENRSGRVIAAFRAILAFVFLSALLFEPVETGADLHGGRVLLGSYLAVSLAAIAVAWRSWWYDHRLARPLLVIDIVVFLASVYMTEGEDTDFTSPFLALFALTVLSAALRWDWRAAARTGLLVTVLYSSLGIVVTALHLPLDSFRFARRIFYMLALMMILVWFGIQRRDPQVGAIATPSNPDEDDLHWRILAYARDLTGASSAALAWMPGEEPWTFLHLEGPGGRRFERVGPEAGVDWGDSRREVRLFDLPRQRKLVLDHANRTRAAALTSPIALADWAGVDSGIALALRGASGSGLILLAGISGPGPDHLLLGKAIGREAASALDRFALARLERETYVARTRGAIARDLHDSVAQSLAGACFRLEALRRSVHEGPVLDAPAAEQEIVTVRDALRREQGHIRSLIDSLRLREPPPELRDLSQDINAALGDAGAHWGLDTALDAPGSMPVPGWVSHELQQLVREAVANAARHGRAGRVALRMALAEGRLALHILDDGTGFDAAANSADPWSIGERVAALGGELFVESGAAGTRLAIALPASLVTGAAA